MMRDQEKGGEIANQGAGGVDAPLWHDPGPQSPGPRRLRRMLELAGGFYGIALAGAALLIWLFALLADGVLHAEFVEMNRAVLTGLHAYTSPGFTSLAHAASAFGGVIGSTVVSLLFGWYLLARRRRLDFAAFLAAVLGGIILTQVLKAIFQQIRPDVFPPLALETTFSFPSGHTLTSFCLWGFIGYWTLRHDPREIWRWGVALLCLAIASTIGVSRMYLGVHWPTDVAAGIIVATTWVLLCLVGEAWAAERSRRVVAAGRPHDRPPRSKRRSDT